MADNLNDTDVVQQDGRILYVEPGQTDLSEKAGVNFPPDSSDLSIYLNLFVTLSHRFKSDSNSGTADNETYVLSWTQQKAADDNKAQWPMYENGYVSFMNGTQWGPQAKTSEKSNPRTDNPNYLSTFYNEISYDDLYKENVVEGLSISNVQICFESFYTTRVTIHFVDTRGAFIFGKEEAIHQKGQITADNLFGCFFTFPYPKFMLQVKGYYGRAVTYQLTCIRFQGSFNSSTGNFEADATFQSYAYGLFCDIPFKYLCCAPYVSMYGKPYWDEKKSTPGWRLVKPSIGGGDDSETIDMVTIKDFVNACKTASDKYHQMYNSPNSSGGDNVGSEESEQLNTGSKKKSFLNDISDKMEDFETELEKAVGGGCLMGTGTDANGKECDQVLLTTSKVEDENGKLVLNLYSTSNQDLFTKHDALAKAIATYNEQFTDDKISPPNTNITDLWAGNKVKKLVFTDTFIVSDGKLTGIRTGVGKSTLTRPTTEQVSNVLMGGALNNGTEKPTKSDNDDGDLVGIANQLAQIFDDARSGRQPAIHFGRYAAIFNLGTVRGEVESKSSSNTSSMNTAKNGIDERQLKIVTEILPFVPCIGNVFKMIMAHFITFLQIVLKACAEINNQMTQGQRTASYLKISMNNTDIASDKENVPPFPGVFNVQKTGNTPDDLPAQDANMPETFAWVGDFSHNFLEEQLVISFCNAFKMIDQSNNVSSRQVVAVKGFPVTPFDFTFENFAWAPVEVNSPSTLAGYLGIRAAQIFGILNAGNEISSAIAGDLGKMDAYGLATAKGGMDAITANILDKIENTDAADALISAAQCKANTVIKGASNNSGKEYQDFEFAPNNIDPTYDKHGHQPVFVANGNKYDFSYIYTKGLYSTVPSQLMPFGGGSENSYKSLFKSDGNKAFDLSFDSGETFANSKTFHLASITNVYPAKAADKLKYINPCMFNVQAAGNEVTGIYNKIVEYQRGSVDVKNGKDNFSTYISSYIHGISKVMRYFGEKNPGAMLCKAGELESKDNDKLFKEKKEQGGALWDTGSIQGYNTIISSKVKEPWFHLWNEKSYKKFSGSIGTRYNYENPKELKECYVPSYDIHENNDYYNLFGHPFYYMQNALPDNDPDYGNVRKLVKALLYLSTFKYETVVPQFALSSKKTGSLEFMPRGYLYFLGALLWRQRYINDKKKDPIIYQEGSLSFQPAGETNTLVEAASSWRPNSPGVSDATGMVHRLAVSRSGGNMPVYIPVSKFFDGNSDLDYHIENYLIRLFTVFSDKTFSSSLLPHLELKDGTNPYTGETFSKLVRSVGNELKDELNSSKNVEVVKKSMPGLVGGSLIYNFMNIKKGHDAMQMLIDSKNTGMNSVGISMYGSLVVVDDGCGRVMRKDEDVKQVSMPIANTDAYFRSFIKTLQGMKKTGANPKSTTDPGQKLETQDRDVARSIYYTLKNLWDRWLVNVEPEQYTLEKYFQKFYFVDTFYRNAYTKLIVNVDVIKDAYTTYYEKGEDGNLYEFLSNIIQKHQCLMFGMPDFVAFNGENDTANIEAMKTVFKPIPYNNMPKPDTLHDSFVIMFVHQPSQNSSTFNDYKCDGFDIWSSPGKSENLPAVFKAGTNEISNGGTANKVTKYGYNVPSFGVSFASQSQSYFTDIRLNMDNPLNTDVSINALTDAIAKGKDDEHKRAFTGQDLFNTFCNLSYNVQIRMMGDAEIQPMMYFQLLNIPMWRGTYMTYKVVHNIDQNNDMFTEFQGIKLSRRASPWPSKFFTDIIPDQDGNSDDCGCGGGPSFALPEFGAPMQIGSAPSVWRSRIEGGNYSGVNGTLLQLFDCLVAKARQWGFTMKLSSGYRPAGKKASDHRYGYAIDMQMYDASSNGNPVGGSHKGETGIVRALKIASLAFSWYGGRPTRQIIVEYKSGGVQFHCLHIAIKNPHHGDKNEFFAAYNRGSNVYGSSDVPRSFDSVARQFYANFSSPDDFRKVFINYRSLSPQQLASRFGTTGGAGAQPSSGEPCTCPPSNGMEQTNAPAFNGDPNTIIGLPEMAAKNNINQNVLASYLMKFQQITGIPINVFMTITWFESGWVRTKQNPNSSGHGLFGLLKDSAAEALKGRPVRDVISGQAIIGGDGRDANWVAMIDKDVRNNIELAISYFYSIEKRYGAIPPQDMGYWTIAALNHGVGFYYGSSANHYPRLKGTGLVNIMNQYGRKHDQYGIFTGRARRNMGANFRYVQQINQIVGGVLKGA